VTFKDCSRGAGKVELLKPLKVLENGRVIASYDEFEDAEAVAAMEANTKNTTTKAHFERIPMKGFQGDSRVLVVWQDIGGDVISVVEAGN
jgi:hypothetical protein